MEVDREPILGGGDQHTLAQALTGKQTHAFGALQLLGHTHHTVARHGGVAGDIGNNLVRDVQGPGDRFSHGILLPHALQERRSEHSYRNIVYLFPPRTVET